MTRPLNPLVTIAIAAAALIVIVLIGYKTVTGTSSPERTDAAHQKIVETMAAARAASHKGVNPTRP